MTASTNDRTAPPAPAADPAHGVAESRSLFDREILRQALIDAFKKLDPRVQVQNPVMFVVLVGTVVTFIEAIAHPGIFTWSITVWLVLTVLFANFAEAMAEGRGKAQADTLRRMRSETEARRLHPDGTEERVAAPTLAKGDLVVCEAGDVIPSDGEIIEGIASVDESAITGESAPVIRESGGDRSAVTGGTRVLSDRIVVRITAERGHTFLDRMITLVEGANRQKTPNEIALTILLAVLTIVFLPVVVVLQPFGHYSGATVSVVILVSLLVCLIPTTIGALLSAIGIAGMDRLVQRNVLAMSGRAVEAAGDVQTLLLDKTGTITLGNRMASAFFPVGGHTEEELADVAQLASLADETPEGRSIVVLAKDRFDLRERDLGADHAFVPFTATTRMSGLDIDGRQIRKGAAESVKRWVPSRAGSVPDGLDDIVERISRAGSTPLVVADGPDVPRRHRAQGRREAGHPGELRRDAPDGHPHRHDHRRQPPHRGGHRPGGRGRRLPRRGHPRGQDGADQGRAGGRQARRDDRRRDQRRPGPGPGRRGVAMNTGTTAAKEAGNMVDLDSNPTKLIDVVEIGKQLLITRGSLTTFSIANDVAKYFAIIPALFVADLPAAEHAQHHEAAQPAERGALRGDLQRPGDRRAHPAGPPRGEVPAAVGRHPAPQRLHLRRRRHHRPVHLHQAHRPHPRRPARLLMEAI